MKTNPFLPVAVGDVVDVHVQMSQNAKMMSVSIPHMATNFGGGAIAANVITFLSTWWTAVQANFLACLPASANVVALFAAVVSRNDVRTAEQVIGLPGTITGTSLALQMAAVMQRGTVIKGQRGRGRLSMPCVSTTFTTPATDPNVLNAAGITAYTALLHSLFGTVSAPVFAGGTQNFIPSIFTRPVAPALVVSQCGFVDPHYCLLDTALGTQRRRKEGTA